MSPPQQPINNPNSLKIRLAYRFLRNLNKLNTKRFNFDNTHHRVKIAAYASMAAVAGSRRAWSRAILSNIRNRGGGRLARIKKIRKLDYYKATTLHAAAGTTTRRKRRRRNPSYQKQQGKRQQDVDPFGYSGQEVKLRKLVPGANQTMDVCCLLDETADYMKCLATQVEVMRTLVDLYSTI